MDWRKDGRYCSRKKWYICISLEGDAGISLQPSTGIFKSALLIASEEQNQSKGLNGGSGSAVSSYFQ